MDVTEQEDGDRLAAFGRWLARERELRGLGRDEVTRAMKLAPGTVEALESGEGSRMPPRAYAVGYLRAYAAEVGLRFQEAAGPDAGPGPRRPAAAGVPLAAIVVAALAVAAALWALLR